MDNNIKGKKAVRERRPVKIWKVFLALILAAVICLAGAFLTLAVTEYRPQEVEVLTPSNGTEKIQTGTVYTVVSCNTGYGALGKDADFFMDGGKTTMPESSAVVEAYMAGIAAELAPLKADIYMLQEVDTGSKRSFGTDQAAYYEKELGMPYAYALNYKAAFVPYPLNSMIGKVSSGLATYTGFEVSGAERIQLPIPFSWPVRCFNLKRCLLVERMPVEGTDAELVVINLHLEAYDSGEGKIAQTKQLYKLLEDEYAKGNYVLAGGDFNQTFPRVRLFPAVFEGCWMPGVLEDELPQGFAFANGGDVPTCRLLDRPLTGNENPMYYIIDGFIVSDNISVDSASVVETGFENTDHQPVRLEITLK